MSSLPDIKKNVSDWYNEVIYLAELADQSPVRGCIVIRPYGYALWENIKAVLDKKIKDTGHQNAAFPLFIPQSFLTKEAKHVEGFAPELAIVTHAGGKELEEPLVVRPTSETMIHFMFAKWIKSWRDLPLKINQWANVVRWEMRTRPFLRTTEFFWQEGHTAHETAEEAAAEAKMMLAEYVDLAQNYLAIPVIPGRKSESEKFPGADVTYTFEGIMLDGKALQMGTSHIISQSFAKAFEMVYQDRDGNQAYPFLTSWGATTRLIGAIVLTHGDQKGLVMPPRVAPIQVVIIPIFKTDAEKELVLSIAEKIKTALAANYRVELDADETKTPGSKFYKWELKGVPLRVEIGPRDVANNQVVIKDRLGTIKDMVAIDSVSAAVGTALDNMHNTLFERAQQRIKSMWHKAEKLAQFGPILDVEFGAYQTGWCQNPECEKELKIYKATIRCLLDERTSDTCFYCSEKSKGDVLVAKAY